MDEEFSEMEQDIFEEWRELGFYYDLNERAALPQWIFYGSKDGFQAFSSLLTLYAVDPRNADISEHEHYGPYLYLKITTSGHLRITPDMFEVTVAGARTLSEIISSKTLSHVPGQIFSVDEEFGEKNTASTLFFLMHDSFDPASIDKSQRKKAK